MFISLILFTAACDNNGQAATSSEEDEPIVIRMANQVEEGNFLNQGYVKFKEYIERESDGRVKVEIYNGGLISSSDEQVVELLNSGAIQLSTSSAYGVSNITNVQGFNIFDMPFMFTDREEAYSILDGEYGEQLRREVSETQNVEVMGYIDLGFYSIMNGERAVRTPEDLNGLTVRSSAATLHLEALKDLGANPTPMSYSEVFTGLQQGTIDGVSTTTPLIYGDRFFEVNKNLTLADYVFLPHILMVNEDFYNDLPDDVKELFHEAVDVYIEEARELAIEAEQDAIEGLREEGVEVIELTDEEMEAFRRETEETREENIDEVGQDNYDKVMELLER